MRDEGWGRQWGPLVDGVERRHRSTCNIEGDCACPPYFRGRICVAYKRYSKCFRTEADARVWLRGMGAMRKGGNPITELRALADARAQEQERAIGEALPHLYVAAAHLRDVEELAERDKEFLWANV